MTTRLSHEDGIRTAQAIAAEHGLSWAEMRRIAADHLAEDWDPDEGIGSSDISINLAFLANYEPEYLTAEAAALAAFKTERDRLVSRIAAQTGRSESDTLDALTRLFAPTR